MKVPFPLFFSYWIFWKSLCTPVTVYKWQRLLNNNIQTKIGKKVLSVPPPELWGGASHWRFELNRKDQRMNPSCLCNGASVKYPKWWGCWTSEFPAHPRARIRAFPFHRDRSICVPDLSRTHPVYLFSSCSFYVLNNNKWEQVKYLPEFWEPL